jgi:hypothetical protein
MYDVAMSEMSKIMIKLIVVSWQSKVKNILLDV